MAKDPRERYTRIMMDSKGKLRDAWGRFIQGYQAIEDYSTNITDDIDRVVGRVELKTLLDKNACEIIFVRRRPERAPGRPEVRRMFCTNANDILYHPVNGLNGSNVLHFREPYSNRPKINEAKYNLVVVWDIFMQDYRNVSMDNCHVRQIVPADDTFWKYYNDALSNMSAQQKQNFMDSVG